MKHGALPTNVMESFAIIGLQKLQQASVYDVYPESFRQEPACAELPLVCT